MNGYHIRQILRAMTMLAIIGLIYWEGRPLFEPDPPVPFAASGIVTGCIAAFFFVCWLGHTAHNDLEEQLKRPRRRGRTKNGRLI